MLYAAETLFTYLFDLFILMMFMNHILMVKNDKIHSVVFYLSYILMEIVLYMNDCRTQHLSNRYSLIVCVLVSLFSTFCITFLYKANIYARILSAVSFQIFALFGEYAFSGIISTLYPKIYDFSYQELCITMNLGSKIFLLFFTFIISELFNNIFQSSTLEHSLLVFSTPLITIVIMFFTPLKDMNYGTNRSFYTCLYVCLALLNIINYVLIERNDAQTRELFRLKQSETLVQFQQNKYKQLSSAYKANRSLIHDTKKHYFVIQKHIENKEYEKLENYLNISLSELDTICSEINTGNLVIDSFVTNCKNLCEENNITFLSDLSVDYNRIPINDYDLCIILGNILDNAVNACTCNTTVNNFIRLTMTINDKDIFYIKSENTYHSSPKSHKKNGNNDFPKHGYGLNNVRNTVEANYGFMNVHDEDWFVVDIVLPIIKQPHTLP